MALQAQTSGSPEISFVASDCHGLSLRDAIRKFVFDPHAQELGEVVGAFRSDGWVWLRPKNFDPEAYDDGFGDEAYDMYGYTCSPIYEDGSFVARPVDVEDIIREGIGGYQCDRISNSLLHDDPQDLLRVLHHLSRSTTVFLVNLNTTTYGGVDLVWPIELTDDVLTHIIKFWGEWAEKPPSFDAIRNVARNIIESSRPLFGCIGRRELALVGADVGVRRYQRERLTLTNKHLIDIWTGEVITRERYDGLIREKHWCDVLLTPRQPPSAINFKANGDPAEPIASPSVADFSQRRGRSPEEEERKNRGGKRLTIGKAIYTEIIRIANTSPDGLPDRDELMRRLKEKFPAASESNLRSLLAEVYHSLGIN